MLKGLVSLEEVNAFIGEQIDDDISGREHRLLGTILYDNGLITDYQSIGCPGKWKSTGNDPAWIMGDP